MPRRSASEKLSERFCYYGFFELCFFVKAAVRLGEKQVMTPKLGEIRHT